jgi:hypothetical protein
MAISLLGEAILNVVAIFVNGIASRIGLWQDPATMTAKTQIQKHLDTLIGERTYRQAAEALGVHWSILWRLHTGRRLSASAKTLKKLGLQREPHPVFRVVG